METKLKGSTINTGRNKKGSMNRTIFFIITLHLEGYCHIVPYVGWRPYLTFNFVLVTHQFSTTQYLYRLPKLKLRYDKIWELYKKGWTPTKIHRYLEENGYKVSKYPSSTNNTIKSRIKKEKVLNQPVKVDTFVDFGLEMIHS